MKEIALLSPALYVAQIQKLLPKAPAVILSIINQLLHKQVQIIPFFFKVKMVIYLSFIQIYRVKSIR